MNIGYKITKPIETQEQCDSYAEVAKWCNDNGCHIEDKGEWYEVVENTPIEPQPIQPSEMDKLSAQVMYTALLTDTLLDNEEEDADV